MRLLLPLLLLFLSSAFSEELSQQQARDLVSQGKILPLTEILEKARSHYSGRLLEVELEDEKEHGGLVYELEILDEKGRVWELVFNAVTGEYLGREDD